MPKRFLQQPENARLETVSKMSEQYLKAGEMHEAEEVCEEAIPAVARPRKLCIQAKSRSPFQRLR